MVESNSHLKLWGDFYKVPVLQRAKISEHIEDFYDKTSGKCQCIELSIKLEDTKRSSREVPLYDCKANLITNKGRCYANASEAGAEFAVKRALGQLQRALFRKVHRPEFERFERAPVADERFAPFIEEEVFA